MPKMIGGSIACRVSYAPESSGRKFYCDHCVQYFDDRHLPPCDAQTLNEVPTVDVMPVVKLDLPKSDGAPKRKKQ